MGRLRLLPASIVALSLLFCACSSSPKPPPTDAEMRRLDPYYDIPRSASPRLERIRDRVDQLATADWAFWKAHGPDREHGGFHGTLDRKGNPIAPTDKGLIQEARHLWTTSLMYQAEDNGPDTKALSDDLYRFLMAYFYDATTKEFRFKVNRTGALVEDKKVLYANAFAIYALVEYSKTYGVPQARETALATFRAIDARAHDAKFGGYDQRNDPAWLSPGAEKETNTHLHLMEAFASLYAATRDPLVKQRLEELVTIFTTKILQKEGYARKEFLLDWTPFGEPAVSYGHDIETAWLLVEVAEALGRRGDRAIDATALRIGGTTAAWGFDAKQGGFFEEGVPEGGPVKREKIWWIQAEALPGLFQLYRLSKDVKYLEKLERTLDWIEAHQVDRENGGWFWGVLEDGSVGPHGDNKGEEWKACYHDLRALTFMKGWLNVVLR